MPNYCDALQIGGVQTHYCAPVQLWWYVGLGREGFSGFFGSGCRGAKFPSLMADMRLDELRQTGLYSGEAEESERMGTRATAVLHLAHLEVA